MGQEAERLPEELLLDLFFDFPLLPAGLDAGLGEEPAAAWLPGRGREGAALGLRTTFSARFFGGGAAAGAAAGLAGTRCGARAHQRAPNTPNAMPPSTPSTHDQFEAGAAAGSGVRAGTEAIGSSRVVSAPGWAPASSGPPVASTSSSAHRPAPLANRLRVMKHLG